MDKPTLKKYWEANSSTERIEIVEAAFALIDKQEKQLNIYSVSKSLKVEMQYFDSCDCPYQINTYLEKHKIDVNDIISFSENEDNITMYYKAFKY